MKTARDSRKAELEQQRDRINGELNERLPKLEALEARATELRDERAAGAKSLALGALDEKKYGKISAAVDDATARADGMRAVVRDAEAALATAEAELHEIAVAEAEEARLAAIADATETAEASAARVAKAHADLAYALGDFTLDAAALADLDRGAAAAVTATLREDRLIGGLVASGETKVLTATPSSETANYLAVPALVSSPAFAHLNVEHLSIGEFRKRQAEAQPIGEEA